MRKIILPVLAGILLIEGGLLASRRTDPGHAKDFLVMYQGTRTALEGRNPYHAGMVFDTTDAAGFFYPPESFLVFAPFALLPWSVASWVWIGFLTLCAAACSTLAWTFQRPAGDHTKAALAILGVLLLNPLCFGAIGLGQTALLIAAGVCLGRWAFEHGRYWLGILAWSVAAIKPHLALPFLAIVVVMYGWRHFRDLVLMIVALNVLGCLLTTHNPLTLVDYVRFLGQSHLEIGYNQVNNDQIVSWNRVVYALTGANYNLRPVTMVAGLMVWGILGWIRSFHSNSREFTPALWIAYAALGSLLCVQAHGYDMVLLVMLVPQLLWLYEQGYRKDTLYIFSMLVMVMIPRFFVVELLRITHITGSASELILSYRAVVVVTLAGYLLLRGQPARRVTEASESGPADYLGRSEASWFRTAISPTRVAGLGDAPSSRSDTPAL